MVFDKAMMGSREGYITWGLLRDKGSHGTFSGVSLKPSAIIAISHFFKKDDCPIQTQYYTTMNLSFLNQPSFQELLSHAEECQAEISDEVPSLPWKVQNNNGVNIKNQYNHGFRLPGSRKKLFAVNQASSKAVNAPKGYLALYVGEKMKRFMIPVSYLSQPSFQDLWSQAEEEFGYEHSMGGLTIPCSEDLFQRITSCLNG
ncbi:unnamed protein product [Sphenostylis stenocarpa]|uniref:Small auxin up regulated protein n=1 Tax=Sphenostylis stenocarpa TaxID=92480 RepID=A0AA86SMY0_9FABA|nr:unnamed protein product [Sphenostylis stenocarpa]